MTANKALLAKYGPELYKTAEDNNVDIYFEAAVGGAIPFVRPLRESLVGDQVKDMLGIVNGTTNYILDEMTTKGLNGQWHRTMHRFEWACWGQEPSARRPHVCSWSRRTRSRSATGAHANCPAWRASTRRKSIFRG